MPNIPFGAIACAIAALICAVVVYKAWRGGGK